MTDRRTRLTAVLAAIVAVLAVVAVFVTSYRGGDDTDQAESSEAGRVDGEPAPAGPEDAEGEPTEQPPDEGGDPGHPPEAPDPEVIAEIQETTTRFLQAWSEPGNAQDRGKALGPYATQSLTQQLSDVDKANLPSGELRGDPKVEGGAQSTATADAEFDDGLQVRCELVLGPDGWMVSRLLPLEQGENSDGQQDADQSNQGNQGQDDQEQGNEGA